MLRIFFKKLIFLFAFFSIYQSNIIFDSFSTANNQIVWDSLYSRAQEMKTYISIYNQNDSLINDIGIISDNYEEMSDYVSIYSKLKKINHLIDNFPQISNSYEDTMNVVANLFGDFDDDEAEKTFFGYIKKIINYVISSNNEQYIYNSLGRPNSETDESLFGILNKITYELSTKIFEEYISKIEIRMNNIYATLVEKNFTNLENIFGNNYNFYNNNTINSYFGFIINLIKSSYSIVDSEDLILLKNIFGNETDNSEEDTLFNLLNKINDTIADNEPWLEQDLENYFGDLDLQNNDKTLTGYFNKILRLIFEKINFIFNQSNDLINFLSKKQSIVDDNLKYAFEIATTRFLTFKEYISGYNFDTNFNPSDFIYPLVQSERILYLLNQLIYNNQDSYTDLMGNKYSLAENETLLGFLSGIARCIYTTPMIKYFGDLKDLNEDTVLFKFKEISNFIKQKILENQDWAILQESGYFGSDDFIEIQSADTTFKKLIFLSIALQNSYPSIDNLLYETLKNTIGQRTDTNSSLIGFANQIINLIYQDDLDSIKLKIQSLNSLIDSLLFSLHKDSHAINILKISNRLNNLIKDEESVGNNINLINALEQIGFAQNILTSMTSERTSMLKDSALNFFNVIGLPDGNVNQYSIFGNIKLLELKIKNSKTQTDLVIGNLEDVRDEIDFPFINTLCGNLNWIKQQIQNINYCSCYSLNTEIINLSNYIHNFNYIFNMFSDNLNQIIVNNNSSYLIDNAFEYSLEFLDQINTELSKIKTSLVNFSNEPCRAFRIQNNIKNIGSLFFSFYNSLKNLIPEAITIEGFSQYWSQSTEDNFFEYGFDAFIEEIDDLTNRISYFINSIGDISFIPAPKKAYRNLKKIEKNFLEISNNVKSISDMDVICPTTIDYYDLQNLSSLGNFEFNIFNSIDNLCCSQQIMQIKNISRLIDSFCEILELIYLHDDIDLLIRTKKIDNLANVIHHNLITISDEIKNISDVYDSITNVRYCNSNLLEAPLNEITDNIFSTIQTLINFAQENDIQNIPAVNKYEFCFSSCEILDCDKSVTALNSLNNSLNELNRILGDESNSLLKSIKDSEYLSYDKNLINSINDIKIEFLKIKNSFTNIMTKMTNGRVLCTKCENQEIINKINSFISTLNSQSLLFGLLNDELSNPRCCKNSSTILSNIASTFSTATELFFDVIDTGIERIENPTCSFEDLVSYFNLFEENIYDIESCAKSLSNNIKNIISSSEESYCFSDRIETNLLELFSSICSLKHSLEYILGIQESIDEILEINSQNYCCNCEYINTISNDILLWKNKIESSIREIVPYFDEMTNLELKELNNILYLNFSENENNPLFITLLIFNFIQSITPSILDISDVLFDISNTLDLSLSNNKPLCSSCNYFEVSYCTKDLTNNLRRIFFLIESLSDFFEQIKNNSLLYNLSQILVQGSKAISLTDNNDNVIYRNKINKNIFISLVPIEEVSEFDESCLPYFSYNKEQVIWDQNGKISNNGLESYNIKDFAPINSARNITKAIDASSLIKRYLDNLYIAFVKNPKLLRR